MGTPGRAARTRLGEYGVALGGTQGITTPAGGRWGRGRGRGRGHRVAQDVGPVRQGVGLGAHRPRVMTREAERAVRRKRPVHAGAPGTGRYYRGHSTASA